MFQIIEIFNTAHNLINIKLELNNEFYREIVSSLRGMPRIRKLSLILSYHSLDYQDIKNLCHKKPKGFKLKLAQKFNFGDNQEELMALMNQVKDLVRVNQHHVQIKYTSDVPCIKYNDVFNFYLNR